jgi:hypothetical protein
VTPRISPVPKFARLGNPKSTVTTDGYKLRKLTVSLRGTTGDKTGDQRCWADPRVSGASGRKVAGGFRGLYTNWDCHPSKIEVYFGSLGGRQRSSEPASRASQGVSKGKP